MRSERVSDKRRQEKMIRDHDLLFRIARKVIASGGFRGPEDGESSSAPIHTRFLRDFFQGGQQLGRAAAKPAARYFFAGFPDQRMNQRPPGALLSARMMGGNNDGDAGAPASGQKLNGVAIQDSRGRTEC